MVCKRYAPHICYLSIPYVIEKWNAQNYSKTMSDKKTILSRQRAAKDAVEVANQSASLTNQSGGTIGFTYE